MTHKFIDGSPVPDWYERHVEKLISEAAEVYETMTPEEIDQLERDVIEQRKQKEESR